MSTQAFWQHLDSHADANALIDADSEVSIRYSELAGLVGSARDALLPDRKRLAFLAMEPSADSVVAYLGLLSAGHAVYLCGSQINPDLVDRYEPDIIAWPLHRKTPTQPRG